MREWRSVPLGFCVNEVRRKNLGGREQNLLSLSYGNIIRKDIGSVEGLLPESFDTYNVVEAGDTVLRLTDLQNDQRSLRVGLVRETGIITSAYVSLRPNASTEPRFVNYYLKNMDFRKDFYALGAGVRQSLKFDELRRIAVPVPPLATQRAIADYLDTETARIDALIAKKQRMIELLESRFASAVMEALFPDTEHTRQLPPRNRPQKVLDYHLRATPKHWRITPFRRIGTLASGLNSDGSCDLVSLTIQGETVPRTADRQPPSEEYLLRYNRICPGQLVVNPMWLVGGSIGVSTRAGAVSPDYRVYELSPDVLPEFIHHLLRSPAYREQYGLLVRAETTFDRRVTKDDFHELLVPLPPLEEQQMLCRRLSAEWDRISRIMPDLSRQIELLRERRQALITAAVTGELEVPGVAA